MKQEKVWVVDENDNPIKIKNREDLTAGDIWRISMVLVQDSRGRILIAQRDRSKKYEAGKWGPSASGTVGSLETPEQNVQKELEEEVGIKLKIEEFRLKEKVFFEAEFGTARFSYRFLAQSDFNGDDIELSLEEGQVADAKWVGYNELLEDIKLNPEKYIPEMASIAQLINK